MPMGGLEEMQRLVESRQREGEGGGYSTHAAYILHTYTRTVDGDYP